MLPNSSVTEMNERQTENNSAHVQHFDFESECISLEVCVLDFFDQVKICEV
jgi:hypothetical protein